MKITYPVDEEDPSSNYLVELGIIVRGLLGCDESEEDEAQVDCEVAIGNDEANSIVSVSCDSFRRNHGKKIIYRIKLYFSSFCIFILID